MQINGLNRLTTDVLIIGGGTAGCYAALTIREKSDASIIIAENQPRRAILVWVSLFCFSVFLGRERLKQTRSKREKKKE